MKKETKQASNYLYFHRQCEGLMVNMNVENCTSNLFYCQKCFKDRLSHRHLQYFIPIAEITSNDESKPINKWPFGIKQRDIDFLFNEKLELNLEDIKEQFIRFCKNNVQLKKKGKKQSKFFGRINMVKYKLQFTKERYNSISRRKELMNIFKDLGSFSFNNYLSFLKNFDRISKQNLSSFQQDLENLKSHHRSLVTSFDQIVSKLRNKDQNNKKQCNLIKKVNHQQTGIPPAPIHLEQKVNQNQQTLQQQPLNQKSTDNINQQQQQQQPQENPLNNDLLNKHRQQLFQQAFHEISQISNKESFPINQQIYNQKTQISQSQQNSVLLQQNQINNGQNSYNVSLPNNYQLNHVQGQFTSQLPSYQQQQYAQNVNPLGIQQPIFNYNQQQYYHQQQNNSNNYQPNLVGLQQQYNNPKPFHQQQQYVPNYYPPVNIQQPMFNHNQQLFNIQEQQQQQQYQSYQQQIHQRFYQTNSIQFTNYANPNAVPITAPVSQSQYIPENYEQPVSYSQQLEQYTRNNLLPVSQNEQLQPIPPLINQQQIISNNIQSQTQSTQDIISSALPLQQLPECSQKLSLTEQKLNQQSSNSDQLKQQQQLQPIQKQIDVKEPIQINNLQQQIPQSQIQQINQAMNSTDQKQKDDVSKNLPINQQLNPNNNKAINQQESIVKIIQNVQSQLKQEIAQSASSQTDKITTQELKKGDQSRCQLNAKQFNQIHVKVQESVSTNSSLSLTVQDSKIQESCSINKNIIGEKQGQIPISIKVEQIMNNNQIDKQQLTAKEKVMKEQNMPQIQDTQQFNLVNKVFSETTQPKNQINIKQEYTNNSDHIAKQQLNKEQVNNYLFTNTPQNSSNSQPLSINFDQFLELKRIFYSVPQNSTNNSNTSTNINTNTNTNMNNNQKDDNINQQNNANKGIFKVKVEDLEVRQINNDKGRK